MNIHFDLKLKTQKTGFKERAMFIIFGYFCSQLSKKHE